MDRSQRLDLQDDTVTRCTVSVKEKIAAYNKLGNSRGILAARGAISRYENPKGAPEPPSKDISALPCLPQPLPIASAGLINEAEALKQAKKETAINLLIAYVDMINRPPECTASEIPLSSMLARYRRGVLTKQGKKLLEQELWYLFEYDQKALDLLSILEIPASLKEIADWPFDGGYYASPLTTTLTPFKEGNVPQSTYQKPFLFVLYQAGDMNRIEFAAAVARQAALRKKRKKDDGRSTERVKACLRELYTD